LDQSGWVSRIAVGAMWGVAPGIQEPMAEQAEKLRKINAVYGYFAQM
jgi:hypothetical protein